METDGAEDYYKLGARYYDGHGHFTQPDSLAGSLADPATMTATTMLKVTRSTSAIQADTRT